MTMSRNLLVSVGLAFAGSPADVSGCRDDSYTLQGCLVFWFSKVLSHVYSDSTRYYCYGGRIVSTNIIADCQHEFVMLLIS